MLQRDQFLNYGFIFPHELRIRLHRSGSISNVVKYTMLTLKRSDAFSPEYSGVAWNCVSCALWKSTSPRAIQLLDCINRCLVSPSWIILIQYFEISDIIECLLIRVFSFQIAPTKAWEESSTAGQGPINARILCRRLWKWTTRYFHCILPFNKT